jgi:hypothetical protein
LDLDGENIEGMEFSSQATNDNDYEIGLIIPADAHDTVRVAIDSVIRAIKAVSRQEERLVLLLKLILENRDFGMQIVGAYARDKAKYANRVLAALGGALRDEQAQMSFFAPQATKLYGEDILAEILYRPFSRGMPSNRSLLLYYMAMHLAKHPKINTYVRAKLDYSRSVFLEPYRFKIQEFLEYPSSIQWIELLTGGKARALR